ncbi:MAG: AAA family ATPase [Planctomycetes bacterium]|nr:AAA family ATPase [Planctomycetota bacterium]
MAGDRLTKIRIQGLRSLDDVTLELDGLTVLIGENGSGKSTILEAFELLRKASQRNFLQEVTSIHGGIGALLRLGSAQLTFCVDADGDGGPLRYELTVARDRAWAVILRETLDVGPLLGQVEPLHAIRRTAQRVEIFDQAQGKLVDGPVSSDETTLSLLSAWPNQRAIQRMSQLLSSIDVQLPAETRPLWVCRERKWASPLRESSMIQPAPRLARLGDNLANCFHALKNEYSSDHWTETMELVRLGLGNDIRNVNTISGGAGGAISLALEVRGSPGPITSTALSDGQLAYLAFVAFSRLDTPRSLVGFDEPELHLHPALLMRVLAGLESMAEKVPVVLATHSDRLLDALQHPERSVVLCTLDQERRTELRRPDAAKLASWLARYRGLGELRAEGYADLVMKEPS